MWCFREVLFVIDLEELKFSYGSQKSQIYLENLKINSGEFVVLCGKSGCGKSTLLNILDGLIPELYEGDLYVKGKVLNQELLDKNFNSYIRDIGVVFQNSKTQFFTNDVESELAFSMENYGIEPSEIFDRITEMAKLFSIEKFLPKSMFELSGGQKQLIAFATACMLKHRLFLMDEPSSNLDKATIEKLQSYLEILKRAGMTIIIAEHRLYYLNDLADRYLLLDQGKLIGDYSSEQLQSFSESEISELGLRSLHLPKISLNNQFTKKDLELRCTDLEFSYPKQERTISICDLTLTNDKIVGIVGNNGAGKSTLVKILSGLLKPKQGSIYFQGRKMKPKDLVKESFVVMQDVNLQLFFETVEKEISFNNSDPQRIKEVARLLRLEPLLKRHPQSLSGGEKQRVAIASAIMSGKRMIFFDEPTSGLDLLHMKEVSETIKWLHTQKVLIFIITHDQEFLNETAQRVLKMENGRIENVTQN
jgi:energy-coupling factor transport system ATP-binding protein